jgi:hypothetical protein
MKKKVTVMDPFSVSIDLEKSMMRKAKHHLVRRASDISCTASASFSPGWSATSSS